MGFIDLEGETQPMYMYKPYAMVKIVECSNYYISFMPKGTKITFKEESDVLLRDPKRIDIFLNHLGDVWKNYAPDWRFGQFISNVFDNIGYDPFMLEDDIMLEEIDKYFNIEKELKKSTRTKTSRKSKKKEV